MHMGKERAMSGESSAYPPGMRLGIGSFAFAWAIGVPGYPVTNPMSACDLVERGLSDVDAVLLDEFGHLAEEESQQQRADVAAVDVGVGHDDDLLVAQL